MSNTQNKYFFLFGIFIFFGLTFFASPVSAATYYCDSLINCNDAIANANSGDVVKVTEDLIKHGCPFSGITFSSSGIIFDCQGYHITDDTCSGYSGTGINLGAYDFNTVQNCKISRFSTGINLAPGSSNNIISNNTVISNGQGIFINIIIGSAISNNTIIGNTVESISDVGIRASGFSSMPDNTIIDNIVRFGSNVGMYLHGPASGTVVDNNVTNNDRYGLYMLNYNRGNNIFLVNSNIFCGHSLKDIWENNSTPPNTGDNNTCDIRQNWHDNDATRCTYCCTNTGCYDDFVNYCSGDQLRKHRMYHGVCTGNVCIETELGWTNDQLVQNCNTQDGWYDIGGHYGSVCNGNQLCKNQNQEYRNYTCSGSSCTYLATHTRIIKVDCAVCDDSNPATIDTCEAGACVYNISNTPPTVAISCDPVDCQQYYGFALVLMNDSSDPDGDRDIIKTKWYKKNQGAPDTDYQEIIYCQSNAKTNCTPQLDIGIGAYTAKLYVEDSMAQSSTAVKNFIIKQDAVANFECSLDSKSWNDCASITISQGQVIYLQDKSTASEGANITSRTWQINNADFNTGNNTTVSVKVNQPNNNIITLIIKDSKNRSNSKNKTIKTQLPLPTYREVAP